MNLIRTLILLLGCLSLQVSLCAQSLDPDIASLLKGHWEGAFIKNNSYQKLDLQFYGDNNQMNSLQIIEEWHPQFGEFVLPVQVDSTQTIRMNTGYGKARLRLDNNALELTGEIENTTPTIYVHLKKIPTPHVPGYTTQAITFPNESIELAGHLHIPIEPSSTAVILIGGRGCGSGSTQYDLYAKLLRSYGVTVLVYNKRGTGKSNGECNTARLSDLASDLVAAKKYLQQQSPSFTHIGVLGSSAGGWVMTKAQELGADFDFMMGIVTPSTSVRQQQLQSIEYGADFYALSDSAKTHLLAHTELIFDARATESNFNRLTALLELAQQEDWLKLLEDTDIPKTAQEIDQLWVRRHAFDPAKVLKSYDQPFLAIYGEIDWIVPYRENVALLRDYFKGKNPQLLKIIVAADAEHGTETKGKYVTLEGENSYWRFFRISPVVQVGIIEFLAKHNFIEVYE